MNIGIVGLGLIGGSIAKSLKKYDANYNIYAYDKNKDTLDMAKSQNAVDVIADDYSMFKCCDVVFVATPNKFAPSIINEISSITNDSCIITDCCSVKTFISQNVKAKRYIGGHPMAGTQTDGFNSSRDYLFENAYYILTGNASDDDYKVIEKLVQQMKAIPLNLDSKAHDMAVSKISHLPHIVAYALINTSIKNEIDKKISAGGIRDITRIASSNPDLWAEISLLNSQNLASDIDELILNLNEIKNHILNNDSNSLIECFSKSKKTRDDLDFSGGGYQANKTIKVDINDKVGALSEVINILAKGNISVANIGIQNSREGDDAVLHIVLFDVQSKKDAKNLLKQSGFATFS